MIGMVSLSVSSTHNPMSQDDKIDMEAEKVVESPPVLAASSSNAQMQDQNTPDAEQQLGLPSSFFKQFHSPEKKREDNAVACRTLVLWKPPAPAASDTTRPQLRRQLAKSSFDLDTEDLQTLALALQSKANTSMENEMQDKKTPHASKTHTLPEKNKKTKKDEKQATHTAAKSSKVKAKAKAKTQKTALKSTTEGSKKCTFRHRKTSSVYHSAKKAAIQAGCSPNTAKAKGREASNVVSMQIDQGLLKEDDKE